MNTPEIVRYEFVDGVATLHLDDGKANVMSTTMLGAINTALDQAEADAAIVVLAGRTRFFSAGFDLGVIAKRNDETITMLRGGFELAIRLLSFPSPVVAACTGHGLAMGSFLLCSMDYRVGANGPFKIGANEVAIGMTMPISAQAIVDLRLASNYITRAIALAEIFDPTTACEAGFLDEVVDPEHVIARAQEIARSFIALDRKAHLATKMKMRRDTIAVMRAGIETEYPQRA